MSAPDELRQLADRLSFMAQHAPVGYGNWADDLRAAAVALRHHANLTDENARLRELCMSIPLFRRAGDS